MFRHEGLRNRALNKRKLLGLASALETTITSSSPDYEMAVGTAIRIINMIKDGTPLSTNEKVRLIRCLAGAKARAYAGGTESGYTAYRRLDLISDELVRLL